MTGSERVGHLWSSVLSRQSGRRHPGNRGSMTLPNMILLLKVQHLPVLHELIIFGLDKVVTLSGNRARNGDGEHRMADRARRCIMCRQARVPEATELKV